MMWVNIIASLHNSSNVQIKHVKSGEIHAQSGPSGSQQKVLLRALVNWMSCWVWTATPFKSRYLDAAQEGEQGTFRKSLHNI